MNDYDRVEFDRITNELIEWMNKNCHPHSTIIVDLTHAELLEGCMSNLNETFLRD